MKFSQIFIPTLRDAPRDADAVSAKLMIRSGMIRKLAAGLYEWLPLGLRVLKKVEQIVREEMNAAGGQEVWLPHIQPKELWDETGRWSVYGKELLRIKDRKGAEFCFAPTAEEVITDLVRRDVRSYRQLPLMCYQFGTKFRDEIRPRFGVMRAREFYMKDAYSFHADEKNAEGYYGRMLEAYSRIFTRCGLSFRPVEAETGAIGGSFSHEFMVLAQTGEEEIVSCPSCGYAANVERAESVSPEVAAANGASPLPLEEVSTPGASSVEDVAKLLKLSADQFVKTLFLRVDDAPVVVLLRGDTGLNEGKLQRALSAKLIHKMSEEDYAKLAECPVGFAGPQGLKDRALKHDARFRIVADNLVKSVVNGVSGANKKDAHAKNLNAGRDYQPDLFADLHNTRGGEQCKRCADKGKKSVLESTRGIEVGHAFKLGTKYSASMNANYLDEAGQSKPFVMGCYGIGVSRVVAAAIEQGHDDNGIIWGKSIAPFQVLIVPVKPEDPKTAEWTEAIKKELESAGIEVLVDDREERAGVKFKDADLIGIPVRITLGEKSMAQGTVELKARAKPDISYVPRESILKELKGVLEKLA